jgi:chorismate mutase/prephenate dehydratase
MMPQSNELARPLGDIAAMNLASVRSEIDRIDQAILDLMEQRLATSIAIAELKKDAETALLLLRPDREQDVLERLERRSERMPKAAIGVIWRELMALNLQTQRRMEIVLHAAQQPHLVTDEARRRFGCAAPIVVAASAEEALDRARNREAVAVIELIPLSNWWVELFDDKSLVIFDCLRENGRISALTVGRIGRDSLARNLSFPIVSQESLRRRIAEGEAIRPLAISGHLRLCISEGPAAPKEAGR